MHGLTSGRLLTAAFVAIPRRLGLGILLRRLPGPQIGHEQLQVILPNRFVLGRNHDLTFVYLGYGLSFYSLSCRAYAAARDVLFYVKRMCLGAHAYLRAISSSEYGRAENRPILGNLAKRVWWGVWWTRSAQEIVKQQDYGGARREERERVGAVTPSPHPSPRRRRPGDESRNPRDPPP